MNLGISWLQTSRIVPFLGLCRIVSTNTFSKTEVDGLCFSFGFCDYTTHATKQSLLGNHRFLLLGFFRSSSSSFSPPSRSLRAAFFSISSQSSASSSSLGSSSLASADASSSNSLSSSLDSSLASSSSETSNADSSSSSSSSSESESVLRKDQPPSLKKVCGSRVL
nr:hypothetical protein CFP56_20484 [Quercus suber]